MHGFVTLFVTQASLLKTGIKIISTHAFIAFLGQLRFWIDIIWVASWNGLNILIPTHVKKQNLTSRTEIRRHSLKYLFLETPCSIITSFYYYFFWKYFSGNRNLKFGPNCDLQVDILEKIKKMARRSPIWYREGY